MRSLVRLTVLSIVFVLAWTVMSAGNRVDAGYMPVSTEQSTDQNADHAMLAAKNLAPAANYETTQSSSSVPADHTPKPEIREFPTSLLAPLNPYSAGSTSGASSPVGSSSAPAFANLIIPHINAVLISWLGEENSAFSPSPIASGLFHPPRVAS